MPLAVKNGRKIILFLKDNIPVNKQSFTEREVFITLQGSKTGKQTKVKLKVKAGRRKEPMQSSSGALKVDSTGQFSPAVSTKLPEITKQEIKQEIAEKIAILEKTRTASPTLEEVEEIVAIVEQQAIIKEVAKKTGKTIREAAEEVLPASVSAEVKAAITKSVARNIVKADKKRVRTPAAVKTATATGTTTETTRTSAAAEEAEIEEMMNRSTKNDDERGGRGGGW